MSKKTKTNGQLDRQKKNKVRAWWKKHQMLVATKNEPAKPQPSKEEMAKERKARQAERVKNMVKTFCPEATSF